MATIKLFKSDRKDKRFKVVLGDGSVVHFGSPEHQNFTIHKDEGRKRLYIIRHSANENWNDIRTAGFWSKHLLWNKPTLSQSIRDIEHTFGIQIINKISQDK